MKQGVSEILVFVILLGFAVSLGVLFFLWYSGFTSEFTESQSKYIEGSIDCERLSIAIKLMSGCSRVMVENRGDIALKQLVLRAYKEKSLVGSMKSEIDLGAGGIKAVNITGITGTPDRIEFLPIISVGKGLASCSGKGITLSCVT